MIKYRTMKARVSDVLKQRVSLPDNFEIVAYDRYEHRLIVPQIYSRTLEKKPLSERWDQVESFYPEGVYLILNRADAYYVGFAISEIAADYPHISSIGIMKQYRKQGLATYLIQKIAEHYAKLGYQYILVDIKPIGQEFSNQCIKLGFSEVTAP